MALKADRTVIETQITYRMNAVAEAGTMVSFAASTQNITGAAMDDDNAVAEVAVSGSGAVPIGILLTDVVDVDVTKYKLNPYTTESLVGEPVEIMTKGWVVTDKVSGTPTAGDVAYLGDNGTVTPTATGPAVGRFASGKDSDGYAKVEINLP